MGIKLNLVLFSPVDIAMWSPPELISSTDDIVTLLDEFGSAVAYLESNWSQETNNQIQLMKTTIDEIKVKLSASGDYSKEDKKTVIKLINAKLMVYDQLITKSKKDWIELGYNPPRSTRRSGRRR